MPGFYPLRPLRIGEIFGSGFRITARNLSTLVPVTMLISLIGVGVQLGLLAAFGELHNAVTGDYVPKSGTLSDAQVSAYLRHTALIFSAAAGSALITFFGQVIVSALAVTLVTDGAISERSDRPWRRLKGRYGAALLTALLVLLACLLGFVLLIIPAFIAALGLIAAVPAAIVEGTTARESLRRSWALTHGFKGRIFGIQILSGLILGGSVAVLGLIVGQFFVASSTTSAYVWIQVLAAVLGSFVVAWASVVTGLIYVDLRMRKEDLGRTLWDHAVSQAPPSL